MIDTDVHIVPMNLRNSGENDYVALHAFANRMRAELLPDDPPTALERAIAAWRNIPELVKVDLFVARADDAKEIVARGQVMQGDTGENRHVAQYSLQVLPEFRRHGIARRMLAFMAQSVRREGRRLVLTDTHARIPAGAAFMERLGGERGLETHSFQLDLANLDREMVKSWQARACERGADFELTTWSGPHAEADIEAIANLHQVMNTQPLGSLEIEHARVTPMQLRQMEQALFARGTQRTTIVARHRPTGALAGFTEVFVSADSTAILNQGNTGVFPQFRDRGLGRWLKAAMLDHALREWLQIRFVRTGNADSNAPMLKINRQLGFKPYLSRTIWQTEIGKIEAYLEEPRAS
jgi:mycothiol synthase